MECGGGPSVRKGRAMGRMTACASSLREAEGIVLWGAKAGWRAGLAVSAASESSGIGGASVQEDCTGRRAGPGREKAWAGGGRGANAGGIMEGVSTGWERSCRFSDEGEW